MYNAHANMSIVVDPLPYGEISRAAFIGTRWQKHAAHSMGVHGRGSVELPLWQASKHYPIAEKLVRELNLAVWWSTLVKAKLKFTNISYCICVWQSLTVPNVNLPIILQW